MSLNCPNCGATLSLSLAALGHNFAALEPQAGDVGPQVEPQSPVGGVRSKRLRYQYPDEGFNEFWRVYPKRVGKASAFSRWQIVTLEIEPQLVIAAAARYAAYVEAQRIEPQYIKYPEGWLSAGRWEDELAIPPAVGANDPAYIVGTREYADRTKAEEDAAIQRAAER
jgi:hypothetical protein